MAFILLLLASLPPSNHYAKAELLLRCEELRDGLWALCDAKHEAAESARLKLAGEGTAAEQVALMGTHLATLVQLELDRWE